MSTLRARGLGKAYRLYRNKWGRLAEWLGASRRHELHWALKDISFDIASGEAVGIIGANGAGKSTLLKMITGTTVPTAGTCETHGRVAALLELGLGFHPEFTGRQNVVMAGHVQGIRIDGNDGLMSSVEAFAEIGDYIDQPVRTYSSGMQVRLAFSVATVVRPDILIVDEALSVGDIYFQQKCYDRIRAFRDAGTTLLFVSHSLATVYSLCSRAMYIENGVLQLDGSPKEVIDLYQARVVARSQKNADALSVVARAATNDADSAAPSAGSLLESPSSAIGTDAELDGAAELPGLATGSYYSQGVAIHSVALFDEAGRATEVFLSDQRLVVEIVVRFDKSIDDPHFGFQVRDPRGQALFMTTTHGLGMNIGSVSPGESRTVRFAFRPLIAPGQYTVTAGVANRGRFDGSFEEALARHQDVASFTVVEPADAKRWAGVINLQPTVEVAPSADPGSARHAAGHH